MQKLPVGLSDFKTVIEDNYYYADKTLLIKEVIDQGAQAMLVPRPRRFGKTLNLSMLRYFFEKTEHDTSHLFRHLKIWQAGEEYTGKQGKYPVIFLTFKDVKANHWKGCLRLVKDIIGEEYKRHDYLLESSVLKGNEKNSFTRVVHLKAETEEYARGLVKLSEYLTLYHQQKVILLIDEYDTPIQAGYVNGYYAEVVGFMRNFLSGGLKDNANLEKGVLTGIMRVAKESIFSGLNNLGVFTLLRPEFSTAFGLTEAEVEQAMKDFDLEGRTANVRDWYNGYVFGGRVVYNPWSIVNYLNSADKQFRPYWLHTADNAIVEKLLTRGGKELKRELESLLAGESVEKRIEENIVFGDIEKNDNLLWSFLLFGGYLKYESQRPDDVDPAKLWCRLAIPNWEVRSSYIDLVQKWFASRLEDDKLEVLLRALLGGEIETFEDLLAELVENSFSFWDAGGHDPEKVYQAFVIGLLVRLSGEYEVKSNQESGFGRYDVMLIPRNPQSPRGGIIIEFKKVNVKRGETKDRAIAQAFQQIEEKNYASVLKARGVQRIRKLAIVFKGKQVWVKEQSA